jgi:MYXO-CTERM domain-containing protein
MIKHIAANSTLGLSLAIATASAFAQPVTPTFTSFGALPGVTFSGSGIPNSSVAITTFAGSTGVNLSSFTLGLTATTRCEPSGLCAAAVTNNNAGVFSVQSGSVFSNTALAGWNIGYYASGNSKLYDFKLLFDYDPGANTSASALGVGNLTPGGVGSGSTGFVLQDSTNMGFTLNPVGISLGLITPPTYAPFNPNVNGEYSFALVAFNKGTAVEVARSAIIVSSVPESDGYVLGLAGLAGLGVFGRRRRAA